VTPVVFRCQNKSCRKSYYSIRDGSFFDGSRLSLQQIILLVNLFCANISSYDQIRFQGQLTESRLSSETIADWLRYCREVCLETVARETPKLIGGVGLTVEVEVCRFGHRKFNQGLLAEGQWVVGGICRETTDVFLAVCLDNSCETDTLCSIIEQHIDKQSTIVTDCWSDDDKIDEDSWQRLIANNQYCFVGMYRYVSACICVIAFCDVLFFISTCCELWTLRL